MEKKIKILKNPFVILASIIIGIFIGINYREITPLLASFGKMYLYFLQMSVIPLLVTSIIASVGNLIKNSEVKIIKKIIFYFVITISIASFLGVFAGVVFQPGTNLSKDNKEKLGEYIQISDEVLEIEIFKKEILIEEKNFPLLDFVTSIIPNNIFKSLYTGKAMEVVFFTILLGISVGLLSTKENETILHISSSLFIAFQKIMNTAIYFLPFGLICLIADQTNKVGLEIIRPMVNLISVFYIIGIIVILANTLVIKFRSKQSFFQVLKACNESVMIAFFTRSSLASIPASVKALEYHLKFDRPTCNLTIPLGITLARFGNILFFALTSIFIVQLYGINYGIVEVIMIFIGSILAGTATAGASGFATLALISIVLSPLGIPVEVVMLLLYAIDVIIDPMRTLLIVHCNLMFSSLVANLYKDADKQRITDIYKN